MTTILHTLRTETLTLVGQEFSSEIENEAIRAQNTPHVLTIKPFDGCFGGRRVIVRYHGISFWFAGLFVDVEVYHRLPSPFVHLAGQQSVTSSHVYPKAEWEFSCLCSAFETMESHFGDSMAKERALLALLRVEAAAQTPQTVQERAQNGAVRPQRPLPCART